MRRIWITGIALAALVLAVALVPGCCSMKKSKVGEQLLALPKNAPMQIAGLNSKSVEVIVDGERVHAEYSWIHAGSAGPGRPTIVLVHGTPSSFATWSEIIYGKSLDGATFTGLAQDADVYALQVVGAGSTRTELDHYSFQACADWIGGFLDALDLSDVTLVGNSYGGEMVWRCALDEKDRVARVVLMSSSGFPRNDDEWLPEEIKMREMSLAKIGWLVSTREKVREALQPHFQSPVADQRVEEIHLVCSNSDNWCCMIDLARDENGKRSAELAGLTQPALLLWGEKDVAYPIERFARLFERTIPRATLVVVPGAGHYPQEEQPAFVAARIRAFAGGEL
jgi:pimeloyl-ACP methyl ester carboxylesterase